MNPEEFAQLIVDLVLATDLRAKGASQRLQKEVLDKVSSMINSRAERYRLDTDGRGAIRPTAKNVRKLSNIKTDIETFLLQRGYPGLNSILTSIDEIAEISNTYLTGEFPSFKINQGVIDTVFKTAKERAIVSLNQTMPQEVLNKIDLVIDTATTGGGATRTQLINDLNGVLRGADGKVGAFQSYTSRYVRDALNTTARAYNETATGFIDKNDRWYFYSSGTVEDTRPFCLERNGKYFHSSEVESWPSTAGNWQGRAAGTNERTIYTLLGGYNCLHQLILVSKRRVPASALSRIN